MPYQMFRLSLMRRRKPPLLEAIDGSLSEERADSRSEYLKRTFGSRIDFFHYKIQFAYVHISTTGDTVAGRLGRRDIERRADAPETGFRDLDVDGYRAVNLLLDTRGDPQGQQIALEVDIKIGTPWAVLSSLVREINDRGIDAPWILDIRPLTNAASFWEAVKQHQGSITNVRFVLIAPNILGFKDNVSEEMRAARNENNANTVTVGLENKHGLILETDSIKNAANYVAEGGGDVVLKSGRKKIFDSRRRHVHTTPTGDGPVSKENPRLIVSLIAQLFRPR